MEGIHASREKLRISKLVFQPGVFPFPRNGRRVVVDDNEVLIIECALEILFFIED